MGEKVFRFEVRKNSKKRLRGLLRHGMYRSLFFYFSIFTKKIYPVSSDKYDAHFFLVLSKVFIFRLGRSLLVQFLTFPSLSSIDSRSLRKSLQLLRFTFSKFSSSNIDRYLRITPYTNFFLIVGAVFPSILYLRISPNGYPEINLSKKRKKKKGQRKT